MFHRIRTKLMDCLHLISATWCIDCAVVADSQQISITIAWRNGPQPPTPLCAPTNKVLLWHHYAPKLLGRIHGEPQSALVAIQLVVHSIRCNLDPHPN
ncbi:hypothetical protein CY35_06G075400 [Sphagnum magellanicum]|nr:hypothetical protein CY35_06G075400 [Sphagnum magellanicum]